MLSHDPTAPGGKKKPVKHDLRAEFKENGVTQQNILASRNNSIYGIHKKYTFTRSENETNFKSDLWVFHPEKRFLL